jgi:hypothetical protein
MKSCSLSVQVFRLYLGDGTNHGLRIQSSGANGNHWTFFARDVTNSANLELYHNNISREISIAFQAHILIYQTQE